MAPQAKWPIELVIPGCIKQSELMIPYGTPIVAIVGEEIRNVVQTGGPMLREKSRKHAGSQNTKATKTQAQLQALDYAANYLVNRRQCIESEFADKATRKEFGITVKLQRKMASSVINAYELFISGAEKNPDKVKKAGIPADNIPKMKQTLQDLEAGETVQEGSKSSAKISTTERNELQCTVESAMIKVVNAATIAYEDKPEVVELFRDTLPKRRRGSRKGDSEGEGETTDKPSTETKTETKSEPESK